MVYFKKLIIHVDNVTRNAIKLNFYNYETVDGKVVIHKDPQYPFYYEFTNTVRGDPIYINKSAEYDSPKQYGPLQDNLRDALSVLYHYFSIYGHPKIHAFANCASMTDFNIPGYSSVLKFEIIRNYN